MNALELATRFKEFFAVSPRVFSAPGRVNLIGDHTDYNGGFVLPIAINRRTFVAAAATEGARVRAQTLNLNDCAEFDLRDVRIDPQKKWLSYVAGVAWVLERQFPTLTGADLMITSNVPIGGGLSSSAALEIAIAQAMSSVSEIDGAPLALALAAQEAENTFAGARVGIMDQLAATFGKREHALLIDCQSLQIRYIPTTNILASIVVCNTNVKHELASSAYNQRRRECEMAVGILKKRLPAITALRDLSIADFVTLAEDLPEPIRRRSRHVVTENHRTLQAADAAERGDLRELGQLMKVSHESLRDDYEVSCRELDVIVELACSHPGVFGARMTGGGFGGCSVNLVADDYVDDFARFISERYRQVTDREAAIFLVRPDDGVREEFLASASV